MILSEICVQYVHEVRWKTVGQATVSDPPGTAGIRVRIKVIKLISEILIRGAGIRIMTCNDAAEPWYLVALDSVNV